MRFPRRHAIPVLLAAPLLGRAAVVAAQLPPPLPAEDRRLAEGCRRAILSCQLKDGSVLRVGYRLPGNPAEIDPYAANLAALGVLASFDHHPGVESVRFVQDWIDWYGAHQEPETGSVPRLRGIRSTAGLQEQAIRLPPESHCVLAASHLLLVERSTATFRRRLMPQQVQACERSLALLERCRDGDLYRTFDPQHLPAGKAQARNLTENIEVLQGLDAADRLFQRARQAELATRAATQATALRRRLHAFWSREQEYFASVWQDPPANRTWGSQPLAAEGRSHLAAIALFDDFPESDRRRLWRKLNLRYGAELRQQYAGDRWATEEPAVERYYFAARRAGTAHEEQQALTLLRQRCSTLLNRTLALPDSPPNPNRAEELREHERRLAAEYPAVQRLGMMLIALHSQHASTSPFLPTVELDWPDAPLPDAPRDTRSSFRSFRRPTFGGRDVD